MNIYDFSVTNNRGEDVSLSDYKGKVLLIVNTATKCGLTPQYKELQDLYEQYQAQGFEILDFPCNQFLEQAPGSDEEISQFCTLNYGTKFPRFAKIDVNGAHTAPLYAWLKEQAPADQGDEHTAAFEERVKQYTGDIETYDIKWNFGKFLVDRNGHVIGRFAPALTPDKLKAEIEKAVSAS